MWPFNKKDIEPNKYCGKLNNCPVCDSSDIEFYSKSSDYFRYSLEIKCMKCSFSQQIYGNNNVSHTPKHFKDDWDKFINSWNNRS